MRVILVGLAALAACRPAIERDCGDVDTSGAEALPERLSETGLYADVASGEVSPSAIAFEPRFPLWTDGASKRRWLLLPEGGQIDTSARSAWVFPVGTKLFKEFTRDGIRIETRMNERTTSGWSAVAYVWNEAGDDAVRQLTTLENAAGTEHDVPGAAECLACHAGRENFTLGFSATQLEPSVRAGLHDAGVLSHPVDGELALAPEAVAALGVLHGNCSHCHNESRHDQAQATACFAPGAWDPFDLTLPYDLSDVDEAPAMQTARFFVGAPGDSEILHRMSQRNQSRRRPSMPPLGTEEVDASGVEVVEAWVQGLAGD